MARFQMNGSLRAYAIAAVVAVLVAVLVAIVAVPRLMSSELVRTRIAEQLQTLTGEPVRLNGEGTLSLWPLLRVTYRDVAVGGQTVSRDVAPVMIADEVSAELDALHALWGTVRMKNMTLTRARFRLTVMQDGSSNLLTTDGTSSRDAQFQAGFPAATDLETVTIEDASFQFEDFRTEQRYIVTAIGGRLSGDLPFGRLTARAKGIFKGEAIEFVASVDQLAAAVAGRDSGFRFNVQTAPIGIDFDGRMLAGSTVAIAGDIMTETTSPRRLLEWLELPASGLSSLGPISLDATLKTSGWRMDMNDVQLQVSGHTGRGRLQLASATSGPIVRGTLDFETLSIPSSLASLSGTAIGETPRLAPELLTGGVDVDMRLSAANLTGAPFEISEMASSVIIDDRHVTVEIATAEALEGALAGTLRLSARENLLNLNADLDLSSVNLSLLPPMLDDNAFMLDGVGNIALRATAKGANIAEVANTFSVTGDIAMASGRLLGIDLAAIASAGVREIAIGAGTATAFDQFSTQMMYENRSISAQNGRIISGEQTTNFTGRYELDNGSLAVRATVNPIIAGRPDLPPRDLVIGGTIADPLLIDTAPSGAPADAPVIDGE